MNLHFNNTDWERVQRDWLSWWDGKQDQPLVTIEATEDRSRNWVRDFYELTEITSPEVDLQQILIDQERLLENIYWFGAAFPKFYPNYGPGSIAAFLGAALHLVPGTSWLDPLPFESLSDYQLAYSDASIWWQRIRDLTRLAAQRWGGRVAVGHTDMGENLDLLASLRTTGRLLTDLVDAPDEVQRLAGQITHLWKIYYEELHNQVAPYCQGTCGWSPLWAPGRLYMLQSDFSFMISPGMFKKFVLPDLQSCCDFLDYPFYHLDGPGELRHLDLLLSIPNLRGIQWIPGAGQPPADEWLDILRRIRSAGKLCQVYVTRSGAIKIINALGWQGFCFSIWEDEPLTAQEARTFLNAL